MTVNQMQITVVLSTGETWVEGVLQESDRLRAIRLLMICHQGGGRKARSRKPPRLFVSRSPILTVPRKTSVIPLIL